MKKALIKDILKDIFNSFGRFLSITLIVAIGVAFFAGIKSSAPIMKNSANEYYEANNFMDIRAVSYTGFNDNDIDRIRSIEGVDKVFASNSYEAIASSNNSSAVIRIDSISNDIDNDINKPYLVEGRLPTNENECVIGVYATGEKTFEIGDIIDLHSLDNSAVDVYMKNTSYKVVGYVNTPTYLSGTLGVSKVGSRQVEEYILVNQEEFVAPLYSDIYISVNGVNDINTYDDEYYEVVNPIKKSIEQLNTNWIVLDRNNAYSHSEYGDAADRMGAIAEVFPVFFFLVAALVCLTSMSRMVDEQRSNIGTLKALGYSKVAIMSKYIIYGFTASLIGSILGLSIGLKVFPSVIFNAWGLLYSIPHIEYIFDTQLAITTSLLAIVITNVAVFFSCYKELMITPALLMRPKAPKDGKKIMLERFSFIWKRLKFTQKVTARNLFRYKKKFFMSILGIAGCSALLVTGFGIRDSLISIADLQFKEINQYNIIASYHGSINNEQIDLTNKRIDDINGIDSYLSVASVPIVIDDTSIDMIVSDERERFNDYFKLEDTKDKELLKINDDSVIVTEKLAKSYNIKENDIIKVIRNNNEYELRVSGIAKNYVGHYIIISDNYFSQVFKDEARYNQLWLKATGSDEQLKQLAEQVASNPEISASYSLDFVSSSIEDTISSLNIVVYILTISAGLLAFVVLYNLTVVNIAERLREIATIKVLGFYDKEVSSYVFKENIVLTFIGAVIGMYLGILLHSLVMDIAEVNNIMFGRNIEPLSFIFSLVITLIFAFIINYFMKFKLRKIKMVESLKAVE